MEAQPTTTLRVNDRTKKTGRQKEKRVIQLTKAVDLGLTLVGMNLTQSKIRRMKKAQFTRLPLVLLCKMERTEVTQKEK